MSRRSSAAGMFVLAGAVLFAAPQGVRFRGGTNTVSVYATVVDEGARLVTDLTREDFDVFDNGVRQPITVFASDLQPITIVVMLDRSGSMKQHYLRVRDAAEVFVGDLLPGDRAKIGSFSDLIQIDPQTFTGDRDALLRILRENLVGPGMTPLWNATGLAMDALREEEGRRVVLVFTDGHDTPGIGPNVSFEDLRARSQNEDVMLYAIGFTNACEPDDPIGQPRGAGAPRFQRGRGFPGGGGFPRGPGGRTPLPPGTGWPGGPPPNPFPPSPPSTSGLSRQSPCEDEGPDPALRELAAVGGGGYFELRAGDDLRATFARVADELHHQYLLAFTATQLDHTLHHLDVRVRQPGMTVRARRSYLAG